MIERNNDDNWKMNKNKQKKLSNNCHFYCFLSRYFICYVIKLSNYSLIDNVNK